MRKQKWFLLLSLLVGILVISLSACGGEIETEEKLEAPILVLADDNTVTWAAVEGATGYVIHYNGTEYPVTTNTTFAAQKDPGKHTIKVKAINENGSSEYSQTVSYIIYSVTLTPGNGYTLTGENFVEAGQDYTFALTKSGEGYDYTNMVVKAGDTVLTAGAEGEYRVENVNENLVISVQGVVLKTYQVEIPTLIGANVIGNQEVSHGSDYTFKVELQEGYTQSTIIVEVNGSVCVAVDGIYKVENVTSDLSLSIEGVVLNTYAVDKGSNAAVTVQGEDRVIHGQDYTFTISVDPSYDASEMVVKVNGVPVIATEGVYKVQKVTQAISITIEGIQIETYSVTLPTITGVTVYGEETVQHGVSYSVTVQLDPSYSKSEITVYANGEEMIFTDGKYVIENVSSALTITVEGVRLNTYQILVAASDQYTVTGNESAVPHGEDCVLTILSTECFLVVTVDGVEIQGVDGMYTIENVTSDVTVSVETIDLETAFLKGEYWYGSTEIQETEGALTFTIVSMEAQGLNGWDAMLKKEWVEKAISAGYTELSFCVTTSGPGPVYPKHSEDWSKWHALVNSGETVTIPLEALSGYTLKIGDQNVPCATLAFSDVQLKKTKMITNWTTPNGLLVKQDGDSDTYILDNTNGPAWAAVTVNADLWAKYAGKANARMKLTWISWKINAEGTQLSSGWTDVGVDVFLDISDLDPNTPKSFELGYPGHVVEITFCFAQEVSSKWTSEKNIITVEEDDIYYVKATENWASLTPPMELWEKYAGKSGAKIKIRWIRTPVVNESGILIGGIWYSTNNNDIVVDLSSMDPTVPIEMQMGYVGNGCLLEFMIEE